MLSLRTLAATFLCATLALADSPPWQRARGQDALELSEPSYAVGDTLQSSYDSHTSLHTVVFDQGKLVTEFDSIEQKSGTKMVRVLATDARGPSRLRVEYGVLKSVQRRINAPAAGAGSSAVDEVDERNPLQGRVFTLQRHGSVFRVLDESEGRVPEGLARLVLEEEGVEGDTYSLAGERVVRELTGRPLPLGEEIRLSPAAARAFVDGRESGGDLRFVVTPTEMRDERGSRVCVFSVRYSIQRAGVGGEPHTAVDLRGDMQIEASTGRFLAVRLDGLVTLESTTKDAERTVEVTGQGPWSIRASTRYVRVP